MTNDTHPVYIGSYRRGKTRLDNLEKLILQSVKQLKPTESLLILLGLILTEFPNRDQLQVDVYIDDNYCTESWFEA